MTTPQVPFDVLAEEAVLGAILLDGDAAMMAVMPILGPDEFYREQNGWMYAAACALFDRGEPITLVTIAHEMNTLGTLDNAGGEPWLTELLGNTFTAAGVEAHARLVRDAALYRRLIKAAQTIARCAYEGGRDPESVVRRAESALSAAVEGYRTTGKGGASLPMWERPEYVEADL